MSKAAFLIRVFYIMTGLSSALAAPVITSFTPTAGAPGDQVMLNGSGFSAGGFTVRFWNGGSGAVVTSGFVNSDTLLTVVVPSGITTGPISIQQGTGAQLYTSDDFLAVGHGPYIMSFSPTLGSINDLVVISGVHLTNTTAVLFGGVNASQFTPNADGTQISTRVPVGATNGPITVSTIYGTSNSPTAFTVVGPGPYITGFSPNFGGTSTKVQITGLHFTGVTNVTFNGRAGTALVANSDILLQIQPPAGVSTGPIAVRTPLGTFVTSSNFFGNPAIASFSPGSGRANTNVVIKGTNFLGASAVFFGSLAATDFTVQNNSNLTVRVPTGAVSSLIRVVTPAGSSFSATNFIVAPTLLSFTPGFGPVGTTVTLHGVNLNASTPTVRFNGIATATPTGITATQLVVQVPVGATTGPISITTAAGTDTNANRFYLPASITSITSTNSPEGSALGIFGQNFLGASAVSFNGTAATSFVVSNNTSISAVVPNSLVTGPITIITPAGVTSTSAIFYGAPLLSSFSPTHGVPGSSVTLKGVNFLGGKAQFAGLAASIISQNNTQIVASVPAGAQSGPITVIGPAGSSTSAGAFTVDYLSDLSVSLTNSANPATLGSNLIYTIGIFNDGPFAAPNTTFTNILPTNVTLMSVSVSLPWVLTTNGNILSGSLTNFGNGYSTTIFVTVRPLIAGTINSSVTVSSDHPDPALADNTASVTTIVNPAKLLSVGVVADQVKISWPVQFTNSILEFRDAFEGNAQWSAFPGAPIISGGSAFVLETNVNGTRFYRLRQ